jgi:nucleoside-diphosphate-sugar epimerase
MRTFIHVDDISRCFIFGMNNIDKMINNVYNVGDDSMNFSKEQVCNMIGSKTNAFIHYEEIGEDADKRNYIVSYEKIKSLGFGTQISMEDGINQVIETLKVINFENTYTNARYL